MKFLRHHQSLAWLLLGVALLLTRPTATAHPMPNTAVMLDFGHGGVSIELILPLQELEIGFKQPLLEHPEQILPKQDSAL